MLEQVSIKPVSVTVRTNANQIIARKGDAYGHIDRFNLLLDYGDMNDDVLSTSKNLIDYKKFGVKDGSGILHYKEYSTGLVNFGYEPFDENKKPGHGGLWSSNSEAVYSITGIWTIPVEIKKYNAGWYHAPLELAKELIPEGYELVHMPKDKILYVSTWEILSKDDAAYIKAYYK